MAFKVPGDIAKATIASGQTRCTTMWTKLLLLAFLAGAYIAFGALLSEIVAGGLSNGTITLADGTINKITIPSGIVKLAAGAVFPVGLMLVVIGGSELFTGNCMFAPMALLDKKIGLKGLTINWTLVFIGNFIGALFVAFFLAYVTGLFNSMPWASWAVSVAGTKVNLTWEQAFFRGVGCNWLVCLAVWLAVSADDIISKIAACWFPIMAFVTIGFEHSVANMFFIPLGLFAANDAGIAATLAGAKVTIPAALIGGQGWINFLWNNLVPVTLGNIVGAAVFVAMIYWWVYIRSPAPIASPKVVEAIKVAPK